MTDPSAGPGGTVVACSHGTRSVAGRTAIGHLVAGLRTALAASGTPVRAAFVDVQPPAVERVLELTGPGHPGAEVRVLPLLLSAGYHVGHDLAAAVAGRPGVRLAPALGPDPAIVELLADRLDQALARSGALGRSGSALAPGDAVTMVSAGSSDAGARADCETTARLLAERLDHPVAVSWLSAAEPRLADWVAGQRAAGRRTVVLTHLLAPGFFAELARGSGAEVITAPLCTPDDRADPRLVELALRRVTAVW